MKKIIWALGLTFVVLFFAGCTQQQAVRSYVNTMYGFSLEPPAGWESVENVSLEVAVRFSPLKNENVSLEVGVPFSLSEGLALSVFADQLSQSLADSGMNHSVMYRDWRPMPRDLKAYELVYLTQDSGVVRMGKQVAVMRGRTVFLIAFSAPEALYAGYLNEVDRCIDSLL